jgi:hypothetical protein
MCYVGLAVRLVEDFLFMAKQTHCGNYLAKFLVGEFYIYCFLVTNIHFLKIAGGDILMIQIGCSFLEPDDPHDEVKKLIVVWAQVESCEVGGGQRLHSEKGFRSEAE